MSLLKNILFTSLFCLLFCSTELYALGSNDLKLEKLKTTLSLDSLGKSLDGTVKGIGKSFDGTVKGIEKSLNGTVYGIGEFLEENGEAIIVVGVVVLYIIAECYCYDSGYHHGHHHYYH